jgi:cell division protein FtsB
VASDAGPVRRLVIAGLAALSGLAAYAVFSEAAQSHALDSRVGSLSAENAVLQQQINQRQQQIGEANNVAWLEEQARRLGFVFPGETVFIITTPGSALPATGGINAALPTYAPSASPSLSPPPAAGTSLSPSSSPAARASPTPLVFVMPSPSPSAH